MCDHALQRTSQGGLQAAVPLGHRHRYNEWGQMKGNF